MEEQRQYKGWGVSWVPADFLDLFFLKCRSARLACHLRLRLHGSGSARTGSPVCREASLQFSAAAQHSGKEPWQMPESEKSSCP